MRYFDLHCDTLYKATVDNTDFNIDYNHISISKLGCFDEYRQIFAIWIPDDLTSKEATCLFKNSVKKYKYLKEKHNLNNCCFAVENGLVLDGKLDNIRMLIENNVRYVTLTWNSDNHIGSAALGKSDNGITEFGKNVVRELERNHIAVDVSHSSDKLFYDVVSVIKKPILATHSNSRIVADNKRNITDEQFCIIRDMGGIVGLNFYKAFLNNDENKACVDDILRHAYHFLSMNGEDTVAIGADFDGADMPCDVSGLDTIPHIYRRFCEEFGAKLTKKIFFDNANMYFTNFDNM